MGVLQEISKIVNRMEKKAGTNDPPNFISMSRGKDGIWKQDAVEYPQFRPAYEDIGQAMELTGNAVGNTILGGAKLLQRGIFGLLGARLGRDAGIVAAMKNYGPGSLIGLGDYDGAFRDAWSHVRNVTLESAKGCASEETANRFNGLLGSAVANTAYNFVPGMVGIFSDAGAKKVRDAQDAIGLGKVRQAVDDYNAKAHEAQFRQIYGDGGWEEYVQNPYKFEKSHPELYWSQLAETIGRSSLDLAAGFKGIGVVGKGMQPLKKVPVVGQAFKHPLATSAAFGATSGVKDGIKSRSWLQGMSTGFGDAAMMSMLLGGKPIATKAMFGSSIASNPDVHWAVKDMYNKFRGRELDYRDPQVQQSVEQSLQLVDETLKELEASPKDKKHLFDIMNNNIDELDEERRRRLELIRQKNRW